MKIVYVSKDEFLKIIKAKLVPYDKLDFVDNFFSYEIWYNNFNDVVLNTAIDSTEEQYNYDIGIINSMTKDISAGILENHSTYIIYCYGVDLKDILTDTTIMTVRKAFNNYINERRKVLVIR